MAKSITLAWIESALPGLPSDSFQQKLRKDLERRASMPFAVEKREGFTTVTPILAVKDLEGLISFAKKVFGAVETERTPHGGGIHSELRIGTSMLMCHDSARGLESHAALHIQVPNVDEVYARAIEAGAEPVQPPEERPYGERTSEVRDPSGNTWYIATHHGPLEPGIRSVTPSLLRPNALALMEFLKRAFNGRESGIYKTPEGKLKFGAVWIGDSLIELGDSEGEPATFYLYVPDADAMYRQAVDAGATELFAPADQPYGDRLGVVQDVWGNTWCIARPA